ncbi:uncharacterized protein LOC126671666 [Mercurialis annua]|uniref:uncharacterized protein LOC126671666 n=1 Tax=Mercurialis annua TaxID=3986 RepID=UPI0021604EBC|nr:uncharacterized protein LOC126671666 [Mercurialis annua]
MGSSSAAKFSYQRLNNEEFYEAQAVRTSRKKCRKVHSRKRFRLKVPSLMRRFLRKKINIFYGFYAKVLRRLKESEAHFGDLFAGNYLFLQVNPTSFKSLEKAYHTNTLPKRFHYYNY